MNRRLAVLRTGPLAVITDLGRPGYAHLGVPRSGALDTAALRLANRLVGNPESAAGLEVLLGGLALRAESACTVAVTGPPLALRLDDRPVATHCAVPMPVGSTLSLAAPAHGLRSYVACSGGVAVEPVLGSRATDLLSGLGPPALRDGDELPLAPAGTPPVLGGPVPVSEPPDELAVPVLLGPRHDWFDAPAAALRAADWTVGAASNRIGLRLSGPALRRVPERADAELPSEPMCPGAVQVPPNGQPVVFLADCPTTGGYPVVGVVAEAALGALAQARPGSTVRLLPR
jgi:biotin-dependent carboxylase-like uncharacterized protein